MIYTMTLNPALDYVMHPLTLDMGFTNRSSNEELHCGGNGINISTLLNELDVPSIAMGIAAGFTGDYLLHRLQEKGIASNFVILDRGYTRINVKLNGIVMTMVNGMGPKIPEKKVNELLERMDIVGSDDTLVLTGSIPNSLPEDMYMQIMRRLGGRGIQFVVDAPGQLLMESLEAHPFLIKPNNHEVGRIFGVEIEEPDECMPYAHKLQDAGARNVIISCGGHGSLLLDENGAEHVVPTAKIRLVNATGAGDSMVGGFLAQVTRGVDYETALIFASACGTATAASKGIAKRSTIDRVVGALYKKMGRAIPGSIARDMEANKAREEAREEAEKAEK
ncbi:1-phosphofructokinase family hexose kinase [Olsenella uli]|uniref:1-phosphofructokinase family hexose kinase n=1 Tax=Olsenella uli TaxID=133926 RepID=UPI00195E1464|nr:1-phosphofructokinase family hexose kinase [Olsenella uli]MBM6816502.1 1-phosphofructokinase family hexose kinase [Olsenella uli]